MLPCGIDNEHEQYFWLWLFIAGKALHTQRDWRTTGVQALSVCHWVLPGHRHRRRSEEGRSGLGERLGATWSARFFPMFPSLYSIMNGFLLVCGCGLSLNSILTKSQNTHSTQPVSQHPGLWVFRTTFPPATNTPSEHWLQWQQWLQWNILWRFLCHMTLLKVFTLQLKWHVSTLTFLRCTDKVGEGGAVCFGLIRIHTAPNLINSWANIHLPQVCPNLTHTGSFSF